jgi:hypothetical protein
MLPAPPGDGIAGSPQAPSGGEGCMVVRLEPVLQQQSRNAHKPVKFSRGNWMFI